MQKSLRNFFTSKPSEDHVFTDDKSNSVVDLTEPTTEGSKNFELSSSAMVQINGDISNKETLISLSPNTNETISIKEVIKESTIVTPSIINNGGEIEKDTCELFERLQDITSMNTSQALVPVIIVTPIQISKESASTEINNEQLEQSPKAAESFGIGIDNASNQSPLHELSNKLKPPVSRKRSRAPNSSDPTTTSKKARAPRAKAKKLSDSNSLNGIALIDNEPVSDLVIITPDAPADGSESPNTTDVCTQPPQPQEPALSSKRPTKKPKLYADDDFAKPKRVRVSKKAPSDDATSAATALTNISHLQPAAPAVTSNSIIHFTKESHPSLNMAADVAVVEKPPQELSPELVASIAKHREKVQALCNDLASLEACADLCDRHLDEEAAIEDLLHIPSPPANLLEAPLDTPASAITVTTDHVSTTTETPAVAVPETTSGAVLDQTHTTQWRCKSLVARCVQGSPLSLSLLACEITATLLTALHRIVPESTNGTAFSDGSSSSINPTCEVVKFLVDMTQSKDRLCELIKELAARECYGSRPSGLGLVSIHEESSPQALSRWEIHCVSHLTPAAQSRVRELRAVRGRHGRAVKALSRLLEVLQKGAGGKLAVLEEKVVKCVGEVDKARGKREELLQKRAQDAEEKARREELREQKKRDKEREKEKDKVDKDKGDRKKALGLTQDKGVPPPLSSKPTSKAITTFFSSAVSKPAPIHSSVAISATSTNFTSDISSNNSSTANDAAASELEILRPTVVDIVKEDERRQEFNALISGDSLDLQAILTSWRNTRIRKPTANASSTNSSKRKRGKVSISVSLSVSLPDDFNNNDGGGGYCEIRDVWVDNRIRTLHFCEDNRPAYVGTWSKRSSKVTARRPFGRDDELINYEEDSEGEWEEEADGEDIMESDCELSDTDSVDSAGRRGVGPDELEYDDMFRRDDDFGSDVDSDGEGIKMVNIGVNVGNMGSMGSVWGIKYIHPNPLHGTEISADATMLVYYPEDGGYREVSGEMGDVGKLGKYCAVALAGEDEMPYLGNHPKNRQLVRTKLVSNASKAVNGDDVAEMVDGSEDAVGGETGKVGGSKFTEVEISALLQYVHGKKDGVDRLVGGFQLLYPHIAKKRIKKKLLEVAERRRAIGEGAEMDKNDIGGSVKWWVKEEYVQAAAAKNVQLPVVVSSPHKKKKKSKTQIRKAPEVSSSDGIVGGLQQQPLRVLFTHQASVHASASDAIANESAISSSSSPSVSDLNNPNPLVEKAEISVSSSSPPNMINPVVPASSALQGKSNKKIRVNKLAHSSSKAAKHLTTLPLHSGSAIRKITQFVSVKSPELSSTSAATNTVVEMVDLSLDEVDVSTTDKLNHSESVIEIC